MARWTDDAQFWERYAEGENLPPDRYPFVVRKRDGKTPLHHAASIGDAVACRSLLACGADISALDFAGRTPLWHSLNANNGEVIRLLVDYGAGSGSAGVSEFGRDPCPLFAAACAADVDTDAIKRLLAAREGFDDVLRFAHDWSLRSYAGVFVAAVRTGSLPLVRMLLESWPAPTSTKEKKISERWAPKDVWESVRFAGGNEAIFDVATFAAAERGSLELTRFLLEARAGTHGGPKKEPKLSAVHGAASGGRVDVLRYLCEERKEGVRAHGSLGTPLDLAARHGHEDAVRYLLDLAGGGREQAAGNALRGAAEGGHVAVARLLLDGGASPDPTALEQAAKRGQLGCIRLLAERGADVGRSGPAAMQLAAAGGHVDAIRALAELGVDPKASVQAEGEGDDEDDAGSEDGGDKEPPAAGWAPIHAAAFCARPAAVRALLEMGASPTQPTKDGVAPLLLACSNWRLALGGSEEDKELFRAAEAPAKSDALAAALALLEAGAEVEAPGGGRGDTPLLASLRNFFAPDALVRELLGRGASVHAANRAGWQALNFAVSTRRPPEILRLILERKPDLANSPQGEGYDGPPGPPVQAAVRAGSVPAVELLLLAAGAPAGDALATALLDKCSDDMVRALLGGGVSVAEPCGARRNAGTPLHIACGSDGYGRRFDARSPEIVRLLIAKGADVNAEVKEYPVLGAPLVSAVRSACWTGDLELVRILLDSGARADCTRVRLNSTDEPGGEAIHMACFSLDATIPLVDLLLERGASLDAANEDGVPPLGVARSAPVLAHLVALEAGRRAAAALPRPPVLRGIPPRARELNLAFWSRKDGKPPEEPEPHLYGLAGGALRAATEATRLKLLETLRSCLDLALHCEGALWSGDWAPALALAAGPQDGAMRGLLQGALRVAALEGRLVRRRYAKPKNVGGHWTKPTGDWGEEDPEPGEEGTPAPGGTALHAACRHGLRLVALRLARGVPPDEVDAADGEGLTPLYHAIASGPAMLDACSLLIQRGADAARVCGTGPGRRMAVHAHPDVAFQAELKRAAGLRDALLSHAEEDGQFAESLLRGLESAHLACALDDPGDADFVGLRKAQALVFVVSAPASRSPRCLGLLAAARRLGRPVYPVWRQKCALDDALQGSLMKQQFADLSTDALFAAELPPFALTLTQRLATGAGGAGGGTSEEALAAAAAALLAAPGARCDPEEGGSPFFFVWCHAADAAFAGQFVRGLMHRGRRCWLECGGADGAGSGAGDEAARAVVKCAAFVPLLSPSALADPLLRDRLQLAELNKRPLRPAVVFDVPVAEELFPGAKPFVYLTSGNVGLLTNLEALVQSLPSGGVPPGPAGVQGAAAEGGTPEAREARLQAEVEAADQELEELERRIAVASRGPGAGERKTQGPAPGPAPPPPAPDGRGAAGLREGRGQGRGQSEGSPVCSVA